MMTRKMSCAGGEIVTLGKAKNLAGVTRCTRGFDLCMVLLLSLERSTEGEQKGPLLQYTKQPWKEGIREWDFCSSEVYGKYSGLPEMLLLCSETFPSAYSCIMWSLFSRTFSFCRKKYPRVRTNLRVTKIECTWI